MKIGLTQRLQANFWVNPFLLRERRSSARPLLVRMTGQQWESSKKRGELYLTVTE
jgi:hypothetical protein